MPLSAGFRIQAIIVDSADFLPASSAIFGQTKRIADFFDRLALTNSAIMALPIHSADSHLIFKTFSPTILQNSSAFADFDNSQI
ncbi:MAG: hypothetical protein ACOX78_09185 [Lachnospiraceae bacterium]|jgi:hypothetical protein